MVHRSPSSDYNYDYYGDNNYHYNDIDVGTVQAPSDLIPYFICDSTLDVIGILLFAVTIYGVHGSRKISPTFVFLSTVFCSATFMILLQDVGINILLLDCIITDYRGDHHVSWRLYLSLALTGLIVFARLFLTLIQALMAVNRLCAVVLVKKYQDIFTPRNTAFIVAVFIIITIPPIPVYIFEIGGCYAYFYPLAFAFDYINEELDHGYTCHFVVEHILLFICCVLLGIVILIDVTVLYLQWRRRSKNTTAMRSFRSELQSDLLTVVLASVSGVSIALQSVIDFLESKFAANYAERLLNIALSYVFLIAVGFINRRFRQRILDVLRFWKKTGERKSEIVSVVPISPGYRSAEAVFTKRKCSDCPKRSICST
ncbi:hypothetical protein V3C99_010693 [Haemonchus contortus]